MASRRTQVVAVVLAFAAAALSFVAVALTYSQGGGVRATPLFGGIVMLVLGISGYLRLRGPD